MFTPDSSPQENVPKGTLKKRTWNTSSIYPNTTRNYWVYVPAQYVDTTPACVMVFQDGNAYVPAEGQVRAPIVFDNLIHKGEMPVTIGIFIDPGDKDAPYDNRPTEYVTLEDTYTNFLLDEILPQVGKEFKLADTAAGRAICGMSDGGLTAFNVAWHRPDVFSKVISQIGSFTRLGVGSEIPYLIRKTRGNPKPIRVFLQDGENDLNIEEGSWPLGNINMASALKYARYDHRFEMGTGGHDLAHGGAIFPDTLRWIWRDYPGVKGAGDPPDLDAVIGQWDVVINAFGGPRRNQLTVAAKSNDLAITLNDEKDGEVEVTSIHFEDNILSYQYATPPSQSGWGKGSMQVMKAWLRVKGNTMEGALTSGSDAETYYDFLVTGQMKSTKPPAR
jgi:enterochelin esterase-like enzyme